MARGEGERAAPSVARRLVAGLIYCLVALFSVLGIVAAAVLAHAAYKGTGWSAQQIEELKQLIWPSDQVTKSAKLFWEEAKYVLQYGAYFIGALGLFMAVTQIKTLARLISDFIVARGPIYELSSTITTVERQVGALSHEIDRLAKLEPTIQAMRDKIEETLQQLGDLQRLTVSERSDASENVTPPPATNGNNHQVSDADDARNWERLRELWNANGRRLDEVIERIPDKRSRTRFTRMSRSNYYAIIDALGAEGRIPEHVRKASIDLHKTFMSYKPRNRKIPNQVVEDLQVLDAMLENELATLPSVEVAKEDRRPSTVDSMPQVQFQPS